MTITGALTAEGLAVVTLQLGSASVEAIIDTGFDGNLQLPDAVAGLVSRTWVDQDRYGFADGSEAVFDVYEVEVEFGGGPVTARAIFSPTNEGLVGVKFLADYRPTIDYPVGTVTLERTRP